MDYIRAYLEKSRKTDHQLFYEYFDTKEDASWWLGRWRRNEVTPRLLEAWCKDQLKGGYRE